mgnify:CR=1 FL=1
MKLLLLITLLSTNIFSQNGVHYHFKCSQAALSLEEGQIDMAFLFLLDAFSQKIPPRSADLFNLAKCYSQQKDADSTIKYLRLATEANPTIKNVIKSHRLWFQELIGEAAWEEFTTPSEVVIPENFKNILSTHDQLEFRTLQIYRLEKLAKRKHQLDTTSLEYQEELKIIYSKKDSLFLLLDSTLSNTSKELLLAPMVNNQFSNLFRMIHNEYLFSRRQQIDDLIAIGFIIPDIMIDIYYKEYYEEELGQQVLGEDDDFLFYEKYGLGFNNDIRSFRIYCSWLYDN